jgi:hypothetical protein
MRRLAVIISVLLCTLCVPIDGSAQTVTLQGAQTVASAEDFATRVLQDPWDMNQRTDFGWYLYGVDPPSPDLTNISWAGGIFSATTGTGPNLALLETGNPFAARVGKTGFVYPIDANFYRLIAIRMNINGSPQATFGWNRDNLYDGTNTSSNIFNLSQGWRTYLIDLQALGIRSGPVAWGGLIRFLQFNPSYLTTYNFQIDWIRLVNVNSSLCRTVTWSGFAGNVDLYLDTDANHSNGNETALALNISNNSASAGCSGSGSGHTFYAGALDAGTYWVLARPAGLGSFTPSSTTYQVNAAPLLTLTSPSEEGSTDDFATTQLGNAWDMDAVTDVDSFVNVTSPAITTIAAEARDGTSLGGSVRVLWGTSTAAAAGSVGDPVVQPLAQRAAVHTIDPARYRILTVEYGLPNIARDINHGSVARVIWRVAGGVESVSDDIIIDSLPAGRNVMNKLIVDMADRTVLPIEEGSTAGWVYGTSGIDRFRFDPHEFSNPTSFFIRRIKLAALERLNSGTTYTFQWTTTKNGTVTLYYDTDKDPNQGLTLIGSAAASANQFAWSVPTIPIAQYYIYAVINDNQGNANGVYSKWPVIIGKAPPSNPPNFRILH